MRNYKSYLLVVKGVITMSTKEKELNEKFALELSKANDTEEKIILAFKHGLEIGKITENKVALAKG